MVAKGLVINGIQDNGQWASILRSLSRLGAVSISQADYNPGDKQAYCIIDVDKRIFRNDEIIKRIGISPKMIEFMQPADIMRQRQVKTQASSIIKRESFIESAI